jgi:four helix bundle protein
MKKNVVADKAFDFALSAINLYKTLQQKNEFVLSKQFLRSATSIGANVAEASAALTKKEFIAKLSIASKEARETKYWLSLLERSKLVDLDYSSYILHIQELINILTSIIKTTQENLSAATIQNS